MDEDSHSLRSILVTCLFLALAASLLCPARAGAEETGEIRQAVARVSFMEGRVSFQRGDQKTWEPATVNFPFTWGDSLYTDPGARAELQMAGGDNLWLSPGTEISALNLTETTRQIEIGVGSISIHLRGLDPGETLEVDTPVCAVTILAPGMYRVSVDDRGGARVGVREGEVEIASEAGTVRVHEGSEFRLARGEKAASDLFALGGPDEFDRWCAERDRLYADSTSYRYVSSSVVGAETLDSYGDWREVPDQGWAWFPSVTQVGWAPYRFGRWVWIDPWGWNWIPAEPWGWAPFHYGRWFYWTRRWCWLPVPRPVRRCAYLPALVAFVSPEDHLHGHGRPRIGWFPLGPGDPLVPYWNSKAAPGIDVTKMNFLYRKNLEALTVVNHEALIESRPVQGALVRSADLDEAWKTGPVLRGALPVLPTRQSLRVAATVGETVPEPPAALRAKPVVTRLTPPQAPASWESEEAWIRTHQGIPMATEPDTTAPGPGRSEFKPLTIAPVHPATQPLAGAITPGPERPGASGGPVLEGLEPKPSSEPKTPASPAPPLPATYRRRWTPRPAAAEPTHDAGPASPASPGAPPSPAPGDWSSHRNPVMPSPPTPPPSVGTRPPTVTPRIPQPAPVATPTSGPTPRGDNAGGQPIQWKLRQARPVEGLQSVPTKIDEPQQGSVR